MHTCTLRTQTISCLAEKDQELTRDPKLSSRILPWIFEWPLTFLWEAFADKAGAKDLKAPSLRSPTVQTICISTHGVIVVCSHFTYDSYTSCRSYLHLRESNTNLAEQRSRAYPPQNLHRLISSMAPGRMTRTNRMSKRRAGGWRAIEKSNKPNRSPNSSCKSTPRASQSLQNDTTVTKTTAMHACALNKSLPLQRMKKELT